MMENKKVALVIVDISGYTQFIRSRKLSAIHSEEIVSELLEALIDHAAYPLTLNKLEGDAAFLYAESSAENQVEVARDVARQAREFFKVFYERSQASSAERADCDCDACQHILDLRLKAVLHFGEAVFKKIRSFEELAGGDVILTHQLLKNSVPSNEYILMTGSFHRLVGDFDDLPSENRLEDSDYMGEVTVHVTYPCKNSQTEPYPPIYFQFF
jgi:class 3 adenylate cyclase